MPIRAQAQSIVEISANIADFDVVRFNIPPVPATVFGDPAQLGTISDQIHLVLPGATLTGGDNVIVRVRLTKPVGINIAAIHQSLHGLFGTYLQQPADHPIPAGHAVWGVSVSSSLLVSGVNLQAVVHTTTPSYVGHGDVRAGSDPGFIYTLGVNHNLSPDQLAINPAAEAIITNLEFQFQIPSEGEFGDPVRATPFDSLRLTFVANIHYDDPAAVFPSLLTAHGETTTGSNVTVTPLTTLPDGSVTSVSLTFDNIQSGGQTSVVSSAQGPPPPAGFKLTSPPVYFEITTTAQFTGAVRVCLNWAEGQIANENNVNLFHTESGTWVDITDAASRDSANNRVCGNASSLSPFTLFEVQYPFAGFFEPVDNLPTVNAVKAGSAIPLKFSLGGTAGLNILADGFPKVTLVQCQNSAIDSIEETVTAGGSSLQYDAATGQYTYVWKTEKAWAMSCRELQLKLSDGEMYKVRFTFGR